MENGLEHLYIDIIYMNHRKPTPEWRIEREASLRFIDVTYVVAGRATYIVDGKRYPVASGDLICIPMGSERQALGNERDPVESYCLNFQAFDGPSHEPKTMPFPIITHIGYNATVVRLFEDLYMTWLLRENGYRALSTGYAMVILSQLDMLLKDDHQRAAADPRVRKAVGYIAEHPDEALSTELLAQMVDLHPVYFASLFRKNLGYTVSGYIQRVRVNRAELLLLEGTESVKEIAGMCGFCDVYYFSRVFKRLKGVPPSLVRKQRIV